MDEERPLPKYQVDAWGNEWRRGWARHVGEWIELDLKRAAPHGPHFIGSEDDRTRLEELPFALAQVRTVDDVLDFVGHYGMLGMKEPTEGIYRERVSDWLKVARELQFIILISQFTRNAGQGDQEALRELREGFGFVHPQAGTMPAEELLTLADGFIGARISSVLRDVTPFIVPESALGGAHGLFRILEETRSPLHFAYWKLAEILSRTTPILQCANPSCGKFFERRDPRQQYCSAACSARMRQRRVRGKRSALAAPDA